MRASLSGSFVRRNIGARFLVAAVTVVIMTVLSPIIVLALSVRYVLTARLPGDIDPPRDWQAERLRASLDRPGVTIH